MKIQHISTASPTRYQPITFHSRPLEDAGLVDPLDDLDLVEQLVVLGDARVVEQEGQHIKGRRRDGSASADHAPKRPGDARAPELEALAVLDHAPINLGAQTRRSKEHEKRTKGMR